MAHIVLVRQDSGGELQLLLQRRSPHRGQQATWGVVGGSLEAVEKGLSNGQDIDAAWYARRRAALREAIEEAGGDERMPGGSLALPALKPAPKMSKNLAPMPPIERAGDVRLPPTVLRMVDEPQLTVPIKHGAENTFFFVCVLDSRRDGSYCCDWPPFRRCH